MATIGSLVVDLVAQTSSFQADMGKAQAALNSAGARMNRVLSGVERGFGGFNRSVQQSIGGIFNLRGAVAGLLGGAGLGAIINGSLEAASAIDDVAQKAGVSAAFLQEMRFAASQNGASARDMDDAITRLNRRLGLFVTTGGGPAKQAIEALGLSVRDSSGQLRGSESIFEEVTGKLAALSSEAEKSALASQLFGEDAGPRLVQLLNQGADGIQGLRERAQSLGLVMGESLIRQAKSASDNLGALGQVIKTRVTVAVAQLAPQIDRMVTGALAALPGILELAGRAFAFLSEHMKTTAIITAALTGAMIGLRTGPLAVILAPLGALVGGLGAYYAVTKISEEASKATAKSLDGLSLSAKRLSGVSNAGSGLAADLRKAQDEAAALLDRIDNRWLQSTGQQLALIEKRKNEELAALEATAASAEQKAAATVKIEQSAAAEIAAIAKRGAEERARETERVAQEAARAEEKRQGFVDRVTQDYLQATGQQIALIERRRETELAALDQLVLSESAAATAREQIVAAAEARKSEIVTAEAERRQGIVQRIEAAWLQATGQQEALIQRRRDAELRMLEDIGLGEEQLARLRVMVNDTAAAEIADIHAREAEKLAKEQERAAQEAERGWERFGDRTKGVLEDLVQGGKLSLQGLISLADDALQAVLRSSGAAGGGPGQSTGGLIGNAFASLLGFADGGRPPVGRPSIVGERGPELFVPDRPGTIIPNDFGGGMGGGGMVVNIDARGAAPGVEALIRREMAALSASIEPRIDARVTRQAGRGGAFAKAVGRR
jgi:hypothetical protein